MAAITDYATLSTEINSWSERSFDQSRLDGFIAMAEDELDLALRTYRREVVGHSLATDASGVATLPADFKVMRSIVRDYAGAVPLAPVSWGALQLLNPYAEAGYPTHYAISGNTLKVAAIAEDNFLLDYEAGLSALSAGNPTNWLLLLNPNIYLFKCLAAVEAFNKNFNEAVMWDGKAGDLVAALSTQSDLAQYATAEMVLDMATP